MRKWKKEILTVGVVGNRNRSKFIVLYKLSNTVLKDGTSIRLNYQYKIPWNEK